MAGVRLRWAKFGRVDSFNIYRSDTPIDFTNLPVVLATEVTQCEYWDATVVRNRTYFYTVSSKTGDSLTHSDESIVIFTSNNDFVFVDNEGYVPPIATNINFIW